MRIFLYGLENGIDGRRRYGNDERIADLEPLTLGSESLDRCEERRTRKYM